MFICLVLQIIQNDLQLVLAITQAAKLFDKKNGDAPSDPAATQAKVQGWCLPVVRHLQLQNTTDAYSFEFRCIHRAAFGFAIQDVWQGFASARGSSVFD
jgi:hypothetical protein